MRTYMEKELFTQVISQGVFASLFVWLLWDTRKESREREEKLTSLVDKLANKFNVIEDIKEDVEDIKNKLFK
ncbi:BhlA/UviB family holin-like peptide [Paraclostridium bifermentans]|uniref:BhlA/UviB family holin-like peptide n=2 Tax=Paraclostridium bifermentans TaxID=1490 RepID=UPI00359C9DAE